MFSSLLIQSYTHVASSFSSSRFFQRTIGPAPVEMLMYGKQRKTGRLRELGRGSGKSKLYRYARVQKTCADEPERRQPNCRRGELVAHIAPYEAVRVVCAAHTET